MPLKPSVYGAMLKERLRKHNVNVWLLNTGWTGGAYGDGKRFSIKHTRALLAAALDGRLDDVKTEEHRIFRLAVPTGCPGVPADVLDARGTWKDSAAYDRQAEDLARECQKAFKKYEPFVDDEVKSSGPELAA